MLDRRYADAAARYGADLRVRGIAELGGCAVNPDGLHLTAVLATLTAGMPLGTMATVGRPGMTTRQLIEECSPGILPEAAPVNLANAQARGIAEAGPTLDVSGHDSACKLVSTANAVLGMSATLADVEINGITGLTQAGVTGYLARDQRIVLLCLATEARGDYALSVAPVPVRAGHPLARLTPDEMGAEFPAGGPGFFRAVTLACHRLPERLRAFMLDRRALEDCAALVISGFPADGMTIGPTPTGWGRQPDRLSTAAETTWLALCGSLHGVATTVSSLDGTELPADVTSVLFEPRFVIRPDDSHLADRRPGTQILARKGQDLLGDQVSGAGALP